MHAFKDRYLLYKQFLAHGDALIEPLLVFLQEFLLLIYLSPQVTVSLLTKDVDCVKFACVVINITQRQMSSYALSIKSQGMDTGLTLSRSSIRPSFFSRSRLLLLSRAASFRPVNSVYEIQTERFQSGPCILQESWDGGFIHACIKLPGHTC